MHLTAALFIASDAAELVHGVYGDEEPDSLPQGYEESIPDWARNAQFIEFRCQVVLERSRD